MNKGQALLIWPWWVRLTHWLFAGVLVANYFVLEPGSGWHLWLGYGLAALVAARIARGFFPAPGYAGFATLELRPQAVVHHLQEFRQRRVPADAGHNPLGWLMVFIFWGLLLILTVTGFLAEEVDYFFGNQTLDTIHSLAADAMLMAACVHIAAVAIVGWWGRVALVRPMIFGVRRLESSEP